MASPTDRLRSLAIQFKTNPSSKALRTGPSYNDHSLC